VWSKKRGSLYTFQEAIENNFDDMKYSNSQTIDKKHGRTEVRTCYVLPILYLFGAKGFKKKWKGWLPIYGGTPIPHII
jgi:hypothetical protein